MTVSPTTVSGGSTTIPKVAVNLSAAAPAGGTVVALASSSPTACSVPLTATVPEGKTFVKVDATTSVVATSQTVTITGTLAGVPQTATLTVTPPRPRSVVLSPKNVYGGSATAVTATLTMDAPAPSSGMTVDLSSSTAAYASVPATASLSAGQTVVTFPVTHYPVNADKAPIIRATSSGLTKQDTLTVKTAVVSTVTVSPKSTWGGSATVVTGTVTLNAPAGSAGASVTLAADPALLTFSPATLVIAAGQTSGTFTVGSLSVALDTIVTIKATRGLEKTTTLTLKPPVISVLDLAPLSVQGGSATAVQGTITLNAPAPAGGLVVTLASSNTAYATVPATTTVAAGAKTKKFTVTHMVVTSQKTVNITATTGATSRFKTLTITP